jgi:hypothetical protein
MVYSTLPVFSRSEFFVISAVVIKVEEQGIVASIRLFIDALPIYLAFFIRVFIQYSGDSLVP